MFVSVRRFPLASGASFLLALHDPKPKYHWTNERRELTIVNKSDRLLLPIQNTMSVSQALFLCKGGGLVLRYSSAVGER